MINLKPNAAAAIREFLSVNGLTDQPLRIDLRATGCCDASLVLSVDAMRESDIMVDQEGIKFIISQEIEKLVGAVTIAYVNEPGKQGFVLTSQRPLGEWDGFGVSSIWVSAGFKEMPAAGEDA